MTATIYASPLITGKAATSASDKAFPMPPTTTLCFPLLAAGSFGQLELNFLHQPSSIPHVLFKINPEQINHPADKTTEKRIFLPTLKKQIKKSLPGEALEPTQLCKREACLAQMG